ncbi:MAG: Vacuolar protein sorting-associated protein 41 [Geoglossum simile]|nr:MAG: Vacuolar protein sorting-associated protein 41 [Geoglossum simile]
MALEPKERCPDDSSEIEESTNDEDAGGDEDDEDEEVEDDEEPRLKYVRLTGSLGGVYRNGDATSSILVAGDKMIIGTHNGNIHVYSLPSFQPLRVYHAHSASVAAISVSPNPPPLSSKPDGAIRAAPLTQSPSSKPPTASPSSKSPRQSPVPITPSNSIHIATSSIDGNVCVASLVDPKDVQLRNFARPVQAVALSPEFKSDRTYLSGGLAGSLILTVGGRSGTSATSTTAGGAAASASSWLSTIGIGSSTGKDTILHSGEGAIGTIKWSRSGKYVVWTNEQGIKIMRSHLHLDSANLELAWKRISHVDRPDGPGWEEMSGLWKARAEWIDETNLEIDEGTKSADGKEPQGNPTGAAGNLERLARNARKGIEKLLIGWGGTVWIIDIHPSSSDTGRKSSENMAGRAEIVNILRNDCIISGLSLYTPSLLLLLAYLTREDSEGQEGQKSPKASSTLSSAGNTPRRGKHKQNALTPELRLIDLATSEELSADSLTVSRFESLSVNDYHLAVLPATHAATGPVHRGALEGIGSGIWTAGLNATGIFASNASFRSGESKAEGGSGKAAVAPSVSSLERERIASNRAAEASALASPRMKIFIHSPYDCVLSTKRDLSDHLGWLLSRGRYKESWELVDEHPEVVTSSEKDVDSSPGTPIRRTTSRDEFFADDTSTTTDRPEKVTFSAAEKEKRRIGELWIQQTVASRDWGSAGKICGKVLGTSSRWEHWVWVFAQAGRFEEITPFIPTTQLRPPLPSLVYEVVLGHYISHDRLKLKELLDEWPPELFDVRSVTEALEGKLKSGDVGEDTIQGGERGRDWRILKEGLAKLYLAGGRPREALNCFIHLKDADAAMSLIRDYHLLDTISDDIPGFILLRVTKEQMNTAPITELEIASAEPIRILVDEAHHGIVRPAVVVTQLQEHGYLLFLFFYLRALWQGEGIENQAKYAGIEGRTLVEDFGDLAVELFAEYDRSLLMDYLKSSQSYTFEKASVVCEQRGYIPELVYLLSKTGQTKRALFLIIDKLQNVSQAIAFAKSQDDPDLWNDLLDYSMDKPRFIRGLLEEVGTAIDPITLVRRIPEGLEIEGLREGLSRMIKEYEIQFSISDGVARVFRGEVATGMDTLRAGQRRGIKFDVASDRAADSIPQPPRIDEKTGVDPTVGAPLPDTSPQPGYCTSCLKPSPEDEKDTLVGFACGHVFHLSCLLTHSNGDTPDAQVESFPETNLGVYSRSVRTKVLNARIIKDSITNGCPVCVHEKTELL